MIGPMVYVRLESLLGGLSGGEWQLADISAAHENSLGLPLDWLAVGVNTRKINSPNLFTVSVINPTNGDPADPGVLGNVPPGTNPLTSEAQTRGTVSWTDGPSGAGSTTFSRYLVGPNPNGAGLRVSVPNIPIFPDRWMIKVWSGDYPFRRMKYTASINNPQASSEYQIISPYEKMPGAAASDTIAAWTQNHAITTEVYFCGNAPGQTMTYDLVRYFQYYMAIYAVALYRVKPSHYAHVGNRLTPLATMATQRGRPPGA